MNHNLLTHLDEQGVEELLPYTPEQSPQSDANIQRRFLKKTARRHGAWRKRTLIAVIAAASLMVVSFSAFAASGFNFDRLFGSFFNNPNAQNKIQIGQAVEKDGLEITLVSAFVDNAAESAEVLALVELRDTTGRQLSADVTLSCSGHQYAFVGGAQYDAAQNKVTLALIIPFNNLIKVGQRVALDLDALAFDRSDVDGQALDFDLAAAMQDCTPITQDAWNDAVNACGEKVPGAVLFPLDTPDSGDRLLPLNQLNAAVGGLDWAIISNLGMIDGRLHVQLKHTAAYNADYNDGLLYLLDDAGNAIQNCLAISQGDYRELVFDIGQTPLSNLRLALNGNAYDRVITGPWALSFVVESQVQQRHFVATSKASPYLAGLEITCSPMSTRVSFTVADSAENTDAFLTELAAYLDGFDAPYLTLADGRKIALTKDSAMLDVLGGQLAYRSVYYSVDELVSLTFSGETFVLQ